jgi:hypothetical protein
VADTGKAQPQRPLLIPEALAQQIEARIKGSGFSSVDGFVEFVLARLLDHEGDVPLSEEDERRLRERLRSLGYID